MPAAEQRDVASERAEETNRAARSDGLPETESRGNDGIRPQRPRVRSDPESLSHYYRSRRQDRCRTRARGRSHFNIANSIARSGSNERNHFAKLWSALPAAASRSEAGVAHTSSCRFRKRLAADRIRACDPAVFTEFVQCLLRS